MASQHIPAWRLALLVLAGGGFAWLVHMAGALVRFRGPENAAVAGAAAAVARYVDAVGTSEEAATRHAAATALHQSWSVLVNFQTGRPRTSPALARLRACNRELHVIFATAMNVAADDVAPPTGSGPPSPQRNGWRTEHWRRAG